MSVSVQYVFQTGTYNTPRKEVLLGIILDLSTAKSERRRKGELKGEGPVAFQI